MAENTTQVQPRLCRCDEPQKDYCYPACENCWKCKKCGIYGGCKDIANFMYSIFDNMIKKDFE